MSRIVVFSLMLVSGMALAGESYYSDQGAVTDSWLQRHYDGYPVPSAGQPTQDPQTKAQESWIAKHYSGKPVEDEEVVPPAYPSAEPAKPVVHTVQTGAKPTDPAAHLSPKASEEPKSLVIQSEETPTELQHDSVAEKKSQEEAEQHARKGTLPGGMDKGIDNMEEGLSELKDYTKEVTSNIQEKGLRGFLDVSPEQQAKGRSIGEKIGQGIRGVMEEVGKEMVGNR